MLFVSFVMLMSKKHFILVSDVERKKGLSSFEDVI